MAILEKILNTLTLASPQKRRVASQFSQHKCHTVLLGLTLMMVTSVTLAQDDKANAKSDKPPEEVEFDDAFLKNSSGVKIDISRFKLGADTTPGEHQVSLYSNNRWIGSEKVLFKVVSETDKRVVPCFTQAQIDRFGLNQEKISAEKQAELAKNSCVNIAYVVDGATASYDPTELRLDVSIPQAAVSIKARGYVDPKYWDNGINAATLRYNANTYRYDNNGSTSINNYAGINAGANIGAWRFRHDGNLTGGSGSGSRYQSIQTYVQRGIPDLKSQLVMGETYTDGTVFDSYSLRGLKIGSDRRMYPESLRGYAPTVRGTANSNAKVQVRQSGNTIYETTVAPGPFEIQDLYTTGYGGDLEVIVTESDGRTHKFTVPYAAAVNAVRPGVTFYDIALGTFRSANVNDSPSVAQITFQYGLNNLFTIYGGLLGSEQYFSSVIGSAMNTPFGAIGLDLTTSRARIMNPAVSTNGRNVLNGKSVRLNYSKLLEPTNTNIALAAYRYSTEDYLSLSDKITIEANQTNLSHQAIKSRFQATVQQNLGARNGYFYLSGSSQNYWRREGTDTQYSAGYTNSYKQMTYNIFTQRQFDGSIDGNGWQNSVTLTLTMPIGDFANPIYSSTNYQRNSNDGGYSLSESIYGSAGQNSRFQYGLNASHTGNSSSSNQYGANLYYNGAATLLSASVANGAGATQSSMSMSGTVVAYAGGIVFSPSSGGEAMTIIEAPGAAGAQVTSEAGLELDGNGRALSATSIPFTSNEYEIDPKGLPMNVELLATRQGVVPSAGAVTYLKFDTKFSGHSAILTVAKSGGVAVPFGAEVFDEAGSSVGTVAQGGRIIANRLKSIEGKLRVRWGEGAENGCQLSYSLPKADGMFSRTTVRCVPQSES